MTAAERQAIRLARSEAVKRRRDLDRQVHRGRSKYYWPDALARRFPHNHAA